MSVSRGLSWKLRDCPKASWFDVAGSLNERFQRIVMKAKGLSESFVV